ncbi:MAG: hypothetical protein PHE79_03970 [Eubacteriales bacterium]|nr:hypothetical protein [Eubacteriales bacterium]
MVRLLLRLSGMLLIVFLAFLLLVVPLLAGADDSDQSILKTDDLDGDGGMEEYYLLGETLTVKKGEQELWETPADWQIQTFSLGDVNNDGKAELVFSLWKKGSFGKIRPFWHTGKDDSYKNHLFVYKFEEDAFKPVWCSSDLDRPILSIDILDINDDGLNELVVEEGQYQLPITFRSLAVWQWDQWGFFNMKDLSSAD